MYPVWALYLLWVGTNIPSLGPVEVIWMSHKIGARHDAGGYIPIPTHIKNILARILLAFMHVLQTGLGSVRRAWRFSAPVTGPIFAFLMRWVVLPCYKAIVFTKLRVGAVMSSTRGFFFLLFTHTYVLHAVVLLIAVSTIALQLQIPDATAADPEQRSILYVLVGQDQDTLVQEEVDLGARANSVSYFDDGTIQAIPDIDFNYEDEPLADLTVPGSIAEQPSVPFPEVETDVEPTVIARTKTESYTVVEGDLVGTIARRFGIDVGTIISANGLTKQARIKPGDVLKIPPVSGVLHVVKRGDTVAKLATLYKSDAEKITSANQLEGRALAVGEELVIPGGIPPAPVSRPPVAVRTNVPIANVPHKSYDTYQETLNTRVDVRDKPANADVSLVPQSKMIWPTGQRVITQYWSWRHTGIDIDGEYSDPNFAVADGVVEEAGWNSSGYGLQILINHQDGRKTRYAHNSKMFVKAGDVVKKGQVIGMVGTTGRSTGTHLHFEVYVNGKRVNPLAYIK